MRRCSGCGCRKGSSSIEPFVPNDRLRRNEDIRDQCAGCGPMLKFDREERSPSDPPPSVRRAAKSDRLAALGLRSLADAGGVRASLNLSLTGVEFDGL